MSLDEERAKLLQAGLRTRSAAELVRLFAIIRDHDDDALIAALARPRGGASRSDPLAREIARILAPVLAPAAEKGEMLVAHASEMTGHPFSYEPRGLADAVRRLRGAFTDDELRSAARDLVMRSAARFGGRERVK